MPKKEKPPAEGIDIEPKADEKKSDVAKPTKVKVDENDDRGYGYGYW